MTLERMDEALCAGAVDEARRLLGELEQGERELLRAELGEEAWARVQEATFRRARGSKRGRVVLLHGIMGSELDAARGRQKPKHVWVSYWSLFLGRLSDLKLTPEGDPDDPEVRVSVRGQNRKYYLPPLLELANHWDVRPFAYDWRLDVRRSADELAGMIASFGRGEPLHLVAHSMGGLVARETIRRYPELWRRCADPEGRGRGGRLLMLGTPNHGSYTIPMVLAGEESTLKALAKLDSRHGQSGVRRIVATFHGAYHMLPSPGLASTDDRAKLYERASWGTLKPVERHLADARRFHEELAPVVDPERFLYVAGYGQKTAEAIEVVRPGRFRYAYTQAGDGRVSHELGLLEGVPTYYVRQVHGDLTIDAQVLGALHELLETGATERLERTPPLRRAARGPFEPADEPLAEGLERLLSLETAARSPRRSRLSELQQREIERLLLTWPRSRADVAQGAEPPSRPPGPSADRPRARRRRAGPPPLTVQVVWGDVTKARADVYAVGHYEGVMPQQAELALDAALSGAAVEDRDRHVLRQHSRRGTLRGELGRITFFPWLGRGAQRTVAVAGMGEPGTFTLEGLRLVVRKLVWSVKSLPGVARVASVLIGSGEGTLRVAESVQGFLEGIREAVEEDRLGPGAIRLELVELYHHRARRIHEELRLQLADERYDSIVALAPRVLSRQGGVIARDEALGLLLEEAQGEGSAAERAWSQLVRSVTRHHAGLAKPLGAALRALPSAERRRGRSEELLPEPTRLFFAADRAGVRVSAISSQATVSERILQLDARLVDELVQRIHGAEEGSVERFASVVSRLLLPGEFRGWLAEGNGPFVFVVDRAMARMHWEMLVCAHAADGEPDDGEHRFLALRAQVARLIRTTYSAAPARTTRRSGGPRALVIGDPGDPEAGDDLPGAREEALLVRELLAGHGLEVRAMIGSPKVPRRGKLRGIEPASRLDVLMALVEGDFDLVHYAGHGDFDPEDGTRAGWVFTEGLLTSAELERVEAAPALVVANACLSGRTSAVPRGGRAAARDPEALLLPSLADELFRRGVRHYVGPAWTINDLGAVVFARAFYDRLFGGDDGRQATVGRAMLAARRALHAERASYGDLWAAYHHYGDPNGRIARQEEPAGRKPRGRR